MSRREHSDPTFHCPYCRDQGVLAVFSAYFVIEYRATFEKGQAEGTTHIGFYARIHRFWRTHSKYPELGPVKHTAICDCDGRRSEILRAELDKYHRGERKDREGKNRPPAAGCIWRRDLCPLWPNSLDTEIYQSLADYYATTPAPTLF